MDTGKQVMVMITNLAVLAAVVAGLWCIVWGVWAIDWDVLLAGTMVLFSADRAVSSARPDTRLVAAEQPSE